MTSCILHSRSFFAVFWSVFLKTLNKKAIIILKTDAFQKMGGKFPNIKVTTSLRLISMGTVTAHALCTVSFNHIKGSLGQIVNANTK